MTYYIQKECDSNVESLPLLYDTQIWKDYDENSPSHSIRLIATLYQAVAERENYYQFNSPIAYGNPDFSRLCGIVLGICLAYEISEERVADKLVYKKNKRRILTVDILQCPEWYYQEKREISKLMNSI